MTKTRADTGTMPPPPGVLVSDGYGVYRKWDGKARQTCLVHLIRSAQKLKKSSKAEIVKGGTWIKDELVRLCRMNRHLPILWGCEHTIHAFSVAYGRTRYPVRGYDKSIFPQSKRAFLDITRKIAL